MSTLNELAAKAADEISREADQPSFFDRGEAAKIIRETFAKMADDLSIYQEHEMLRIAFSGLGVDEENAMKAKAIIDERDALRAEVDKLTKDQTINDVEFAKLTFEVAKLREDKERLIQVCQYAIEHNPYIGHTNRELMIQAIDAARKDGAK